MNIMAEVFIDRNLPFGFSKHASSFGSKPRPINSWSGKMGIWKPAAFYRELRGLFFSEGEEEAVGRIGGEIGKA